MDVGGLETEKVSFARLESRGPRIEFQTWLRGGSD
jgi:hypothetical protein